MTSDKLKLANNLNKKIEIAEKTQSSLSYFNQDNFVEREFYVMVTGFGSGERSITIGRKHFKSVMALLSKMNEQDLNDLKKEFEQI